MAGNKNSGRPMDNEFSVYALKKSLRKLDRQLETLNTTAPKLYASIQANKQRGLVNPFAAALEYGKGVARLEFIDRVGTSANVYRARKSTGAGRIRHAVASEADAEKLASKIVALYVERGLSKIHISKLVSGVAGRAVSVKAIGKLLDDLQIVRKGQGRK